jgi:hypothetical protein
VEKRDAYRVLVGIPDHLKSPAVDGRILLRWILEKQGEGDKWRDFVNAVMNLRVA